jgi:hypothetical protein
LRCVGGTPGRLDNNGQSWSEKAGEMESLTANQAPDHA